MLEINNKTCKFGTLKAPLSQRVLSRKQILKPFQIIVYNCCTNFSLLLSRTANNNCAQLLYELLTFIIKNCFVCEREIYLQRSYLDKHYYVSYVSK